jgi:hypothetical protein
MASRCAEKVVVSLLFFGKKKISLTHREIAIIVSYNLMHDICWEDLQGTGKSLRPCLLVEYFRGLEGIIPNPEISQVACLLLQVWGG